MTTEIGCRLVQIRGQKSQASFAQELGVHKNTLGGYERGERKPDSDTLIRLTEAGYNANWVLTGKGPMILIDEAHSAADPGLPPSIHEDLGFSIAFTATPKDTSNEDYAGKDIGEPVRFEEREAYFERARKADVAAAMPNVVAIPTTLYARLAGPLAELVPNEKHREPVLETTLEVLRAATRNNVVDMLHLDEGDLRNAVGLAVSACTLVLDRKDAQEKALRAALKANVRSKREDSEES